jgi:predicted transcriptional regulator
VLTALYIVCLEDGKKLKMLKRHLKTRYDLTPEAYRQRWGLPRGDVTFRDLGQHR